MNLLDRLIGYVSPAAGIRRAHARSVLQRTYQGAEANRLTNSKRPKNQAADQELLGPFGADAARAWARSLVRDNAYAWNVVDTIVSNVVGDGITAQSTYETPEGEDVEDVNDIRDKVWAEWCEVADINGELTFNEIQILAMREIVEAGEVLIRLIKTPSKEYKGIARPVPLALEMIEADRLSADRDTFTTRATLASGNRVIRGVELDEKGKPVAYWIYPEHPNSPYSFKNQNPERIPANEILHLYRKDRVGQTRGVTWFAPIMSWMRDLGIYVDNEIQASAVASCFGVAIKTERPAGNLLGPSDEDTTDTNGNSLEYLEPAMVVRLQPGESVESINPGRPNSASEPWINLMLRGICAGTGTNYEAIAKDFSKTSYSSSRSSKLEDRPRYKRNQNYIVNHLCMPVWDAFCNAAALAGLDGFPTSTELLEDRRKYAPVEWQLPEQEWVDPSSEQSAAESSLNSYTDTYQNVLGSRGLSYRSVFYQRAKEEKLRIKLQLLTPEEKTAQMMAKQTESNQPATSDASVNGAPTPMGAGAPEMGTSEMMGLSTQQWNRNRKAIQKTLDELAAGTMSEAAARVFLSSVGMSPANVDVLIADVADGTVDTQLPTEVARQFKIENCIDDNSCEECVTRNCGTGDGGFQVGNECGGGGGGSSGGGKDAPKSFQDSEVKDEDGKLLDLYHGTSSDFEEFDNDAKGMSTGGAGTDEGFFFSESKDHAEYWAGQSAEKLGGSPKLKTVNLNAKKVLTVPIEDTDNSAYPIEDALEKAREGDYEAIKFEGLKDDESGKHRPTWFVFDAKQVHTKKTSEIKESADAN